MKLVPVMADFFCLGYLRPSGDEANLSPGGIRKSENMDRELRVRSRHLGAGKIYMFWAACVPVPLTGKIDLSQISIDIIFQLYQIRGLYHLSKPSHYDNILLRKLP